MNRVDESNKMLYTYLDKRRTVKYWKKVVFNIFARMVLNAYIIYSQNWQGTKLNRLQFTSNIIGAIEEEWLASKNAPWNTTDKYKVIFRKIAWAKLATM